MNTFEIVGLTLSLGLIFGAVFVHNIFYFKIEKLFKLLIRECLLIMPLGIILLVYQIYKSSSWEISPSTDGYILLFMYLAHGLSMFLYYIMPRSGSNSSRQIMSLSLPFVLTPASTLTFIVIEVFRIH